MATQNTIYFILIKVHVVVQTWEIVQHLNRLHKLAISLTLLPFVTYKAAAILNLLR